MSKKVLVVVECIAPVGSVASIRFTKIGKYLAKDYGCMVDVLTSRKNFGKSRNNSEYCRFDETLLDDLKWFNNIYEIPESFMSGLVNRLFNFLKRHGAGYHPEKVAEAQNNQDAKQREAPKGLRALLWRLFVYFRNSSKKRKAFQAGVDWNEYDAVISTYGPKWAHEIAKAAKRKKIGDFVWIADFRDPPFVKEDNATAKDIRFFSDVEKEADYLTGVSEGALPNPESFSLEKFKLISNGYDPDELIDRKRLESDRFFVTYTGSLYDVYPRCSDLMPVFRALEELIIEKKIDPKDISFVYCGNDGDKFSKQASMHKLVPIDNRGLIPRSDAILLQNESSLLALATWNTQGSQGVITGKVFEYFCSGVPIVCVCSGDVPNSISKDMIQKSNTGFCYEEANSEADCPILKQFILNKYKEWKTSGLTNCESDWEYIKAYGHDKLAQSFYELF